MKEVMTGGSISISVALNFYNAIVTHQKKCWKRFKLNTGLGEKQDASAEFPDRSEAMGALIEKFLI